MSNSKDLLTGARRNRIDWAVEFGWRFWLPFLLIPPAILLASERQYVWAAIASIAGLLMAEGNGKDIARKKAERGASR